MNQLLIKKNNELSKKKKKGFTLVELVIVIAIIAILAAMAIPKLGSMRTNAKVSNDVAAAKNIATIASTMVANGALSTPTSNLDISTDAASSLRSQLDGKVASSGKSEASGNAFIVNVGNDGTITVSVSGTKSSHTLYPDDSGAERTGYAGDLS